jgi:hypothetical protein
MINGKEFKRKVPWPNQGMFLAIPWVGGGTEEKHERFQDIWFSFRDSNRVPLDTSIQQYHDSNLNYISTQ